MRFEDERYVRVYTRDSATWAMLSFESQTLLLHLLRKVDRAGVLDVVEGEEVEAVASLIRAPVDFVAKGLPGLLKRGVMLVGNGQIRFPRFLEAQECKASDKARQQKHRELAALGLLALPAGEVTKRDAPAEVVTPRDPPSPDVTERHDLSRGVTPSRAVPSRAVSFIPPLAQIGSGEASSSPQGSPQGSTVTPLWGRVASRLAAWMIWTRDSSKRFTKASNASVEAKATDWALNFCLKYEPDDALLQLLQEAFIGYLEDPWSREEGRDGRIEIFMSENVWQPRWDKLRLEHQPAMLFGAAS